MGGLSWWHWLIIIAVFILLFGAKKLPDAARGLGRSLRILKSEVSAMHEDDPKPKAPTETDATAAQATPTAQIAATPMATPVTQVPPVATAPVVQPTPVQQPVAQPMQQPVINGVPLSEQQSS